MEISEFIGLDVGQKRTGIARASSAAKIPEALESVNTSELISKLKDLIGSNEISAIVVGIPRSLDGNETLQTKWVRNWLESAKKKVDKPFYWQDEALTSLKARQSEKVDEHSGAAEIILQDFLDTPEQERQRA